MELSALGILGSVGIRSDAAKLLSERVKIIFM